MIYGFAGPEIAVGPRLGLDADASITVPAKGDPTFAFNASLKCGVQSLIGAKLKILKWTLADWNTTFAYRPNGQFGNIRHDFRLYQHSLFHMIHPMSINFASITVTLSIVVFFSLAITKIQLFIEKQLFLPHYFGVGNFSYII